MSASRSLGGWRVRCRWIRVIVKGGVGFVGLGLVIVYRVSDES